MIRTPSGKNLMNEQEAIQWLLDNNALPFQCTADYVGGAEIGLGTIVNPTPAKVRVGSLIFFADSKVSTVIAITSNSFICSDEYNDLVDDIVYVQNVAINASGHLICVLSNGTNIDAGLIKQVSSFSINASQHLIVTYNDGTYTDLGAIFSGNVNIAGNLTADSIIENMSGYTFQLTDVKTNFTVNITYASAVKTGNKITFVWAYEITRTGAVDQNFSRVGNFNIPSAVGAKLYPYTLGWSSDILSSKKQTVYSNLNVAVDLNAQLFKGSNSYIFLILYGLDNLVENTTYIGRTEITFLLSDNLAS